jgi:hypothetical protein
MVWLTLQLRVRSGSGSFFSLVDMIPTSETLTNSGSCFSLVNMIVTCEALIIASGDTCEQ